MEFRRARGDMWTATSTAIFSPSNMSALAGPVIASNISGGNVDSPLRWLNAINSAKKSSLWRGTGVLCCGRGVRIQGRRDRKESLTEECQKTMKAMSSTLASAMRRSALLSFTRDCDKSDRVVIMGFEVGRELSGWITSATVSTGACG